MANWIEFHFLECSINALCFSRNEGIKVPFGFGISKDLSNMDPSF